MDLSTSQTSNTNSTDFIDFMKDDHRRHVTTTTKEEIVASYDFQPLPPVSTPTRANSSPLRNYGSLDSIETAKVISGKDNNSVDRALVSEIDKTMKKYADNLLHALEGLGARLSQMEGRTHQLEESVDDLKVAVGNNYGSSDGKMRQLENLLREVQSDVHLIRDKQEIMEAQFQLAKLQVSKVEQEPEIHHNMQPATASAPQQLPPGTHSTAPPSLPPSNSAPPPSQQNLPQHVQVPPILQRDSYFPQPGQMPENESQQYQMPPPQQLQAAPPQQLPPQTQYQVPPQPQYSQPPPPPPPPQQPHPSLSAHNHHPSQPPLGHHPEETQYMQSQSYPVSSHQPPSHSPTGAPLSQQFSGAPPNMYEPQPNRLGPGAPPNMYEPQPNRHGPGVSGGYGSMSASGDPYSYSSSPSQYGSGSPVKAPQLSAPPMGQAAGMGYPQLPTARLLPQAVPTASSVSGGPGSPGTGNRVPVDDVIDKVTTMGFPREQVKATVRRLTENGQSVDLNIVLDKLMNEGDGQPPRGWFGR